MLQFNCFPGGKKNVVTFSYDDGSANDARLVELFNRYGVKGTFHLNGKKYLDKTPEELEKIRKLYEGHEIACHTMQHGFLNRMPYVSMINEIFEDRKVLEKIAGYPVTGMSYPSGTFNDAALEALRSCGIVYSRTTEKPIASTVLCTAWEISPSLLPTTALAMAFSSERRVPSSSRCVSGETFPQVKV